MHSDSEALLERRLGTKVLAEHRRWMREALAEAHKAYSSGEVPVGAVAVYQGEVIARTHNLRETSNDPTAHAEILALRQAGMRLGSWRLTDVVLYVTLEPCPMCSGAIVQARIKHLVFGAFDDKAGAVGSVLDLIRSDLYPNDIQVTGGVLSAECSELLQKFFIERRD